MSARVGSAVEAWEDEGGSAPALAGAPETSISGTESQIEWAGRIKRRVNEEFDRVARSIRAVASKQNDAKRAEADSILAILEDKRAFVMSQENAGYFIRDWQEISDQVRQMILQDARYVAIKSRAARRK